MKWKKIKETPIPYMGEFIFVCDSKTNTIYSAKCSGGLRVFSPIDTIIPYFKYYNLQGEMVDGIPDYDHWIFAEEIAHLISKD
jgi:hypothetical protein